MPKGRICIGSSARVSTWPQHILWCAKASFCCSTLYWLPRCAIFSGYMDGSNCRQLETSMTGTAVIALHVDQGSNSLYWVSTTRSIRGSSSFQIFYATLGSQNPQVLIRLADYVKQLRTAGNRVFWLSSASRQLFSCRKVSADGFKRHEFRRGEAEMVDNFYETHAGNQPTMMAYPCAGNLCSHICVPTPTGYMRCLCPAGLELLSNGKTCADPGRQKGNKGARMLAPEAVREREGNCDEDYFPCLLSSLQCIHLRLVCNGVNGCSDFSDEDPRKPFPQFQYTLIS